MLLSQIFDLNSPVQGFMKQKAHWEIWYSWDDIIHVFTFIFRLRKVLNIRNKAESVDQS